MSANDQRTPTTGGFPPNPPSRAQPSFNGAALDGCPFVSRDGKRFYMASNRPGGLGGIDIWVASRDSVGEPWGAPVNVGAPVNSASNDFCPTIARDGHLFYFVSNRPGGCGGDDIYTTRLRPGGWDPVVNLGCDVNSAANEASPMPLPERSTGPVLYFSSTRSGNSDLYESASHGGAFGAASAVAELNTGAQDGQPNLRRDGLEIFFFSSRAGEQRHLLGNPRERLGAVVDAGQPWHVRQQPRLGDEAVAVVGRDDALLRLDSGRRRGRLRPLRHDARAAERQLSSLA